MSFSYGTLLGSNYHEYDEMDGVFDWLAMGAGWPPQFSTGDRRE